MDATATALYNEKFLRDSDIVNQAPAVTLDDIADQIPYNDARTYKTSAQIVPRKIHNSMVQFFTKNMADVTTCLYVTKQACGNVITSICNLFPELKFIIVSTMAVDNLRVKSAVLYNSRGKSMDLDGAKRAMAMAMEGPARVYIIEQAMNNNIARAAASYDLLFISDHRTQTRNNIGVPDVFDILWNMSQQYNWMCLMKPVMSMVKFRHPFYVERAEIFDDLSKKVPYALDFKMSREHGIDFIAACHKRELTFWDGTIYLQTFNGENSTETRLVTDCSRIVNWGTSADYDNKMLYFNLINRCYTHHANNSTDYRIGFDNCNDCALENLIWSEYIASRGEEPTPEAVLRYVRALSWIGITHLRQQDHGKFFDSLQSTLNSNLNDTYVNMLAVNALRRLNTGQLKSIGKIAESRLGGHCAGNLLDK